MILIPIQFVSKSRAFRRRPLVTCTAGTENGGTDMHYFVCIYVALFLHHPLHTLVVPSHAVTEVWIPSCLWYWTCLFWPCWTPSWLCASVGTVGRCRRNSRLHFTRDTAGDGGRSGPLWPRVRLVVTWRLHVRDALWWNSVLCRVTCRNLRQNHESWGNTMQTMIETEIHVLLIEIRMRFDLI